MAWVMSEVALFVAYPSAMKDWLVRIRDITLPPLAGTPSVILDCDLITR